MRKEWDRSNRIHLTTQQQQYIIIKMMVMAR